MKGKCYSMVDQGQRRKADDYPTHYGLTRLFLLREDFSDCGSIWEPCAGKGEMAKVLLELATLPDLIVTDKYNPGARYLDGVFAVKYAPRDFLEEPKMGEQSNIDAIVTNPPYSLFLPIIQKAKAVARKKIAMLLPLSYLQGQQRYDELWQDKEFPLARIYVFNRFPDMTAPLREDGKFPTSMLSMAWYVWEKEYRGCPTIQWIDCREYVLRKGE